ncbi:uncharacterized protein V1513DRAFT_443481 [Lipomyces chichibuensis]|uniref:uncharacterized protein n=1 Tax=Lipomyces chichibuensis TaxID=1546026 RepID=UPI0033438E52
MDIKDRTLADLSETAALLHLQYHDSIHATQLQDLYEHGRLSEILTVKLEQQKSELERQFVEQVSEKKSLEINIKGLEITIKDIANENAKLQSDLTLSEKRYAALQQTNETIEKKLAEAQKESATANREMVESQKKANEATQENLKLKMEIQTLKDQMKALNDVSGVREKATEEKAIQAERKSSELEKRLRAVEDNAKTNANKNATLKTRNKELEGICKDLEEKVREIEKESLRERSAASKADKKELKILEKQHRDEITTLTTQLTRQTMLVERAQKELAKAKEQFQEMQTALETKLDAARSQFKSMAGKSGKSVRVEAPATSLLFTPDRSQPQNLRSRANAAPEKLLEKSSFSMTPFLNRQSGVMPLSPVDTNRQYEKSTELEKLVDSARDESTESTSKSDSDYVEPAAKPKSANAAGQKPVQRRRSASTAASLAALVSEELERSALAVQQKKKKRKLGLSRGPTLFDEVNEGSLESEPKKAKLDVASRTKMAAPVAQRAFLGAKEISPLKKRNEKLRDMFKLS